MIRCPNKNDPKWKVLVDALGEQRAYQAYFRHKAGGAIPEPEVAHLLLGGKPPQPKAEGQISVSRGPESLGIAPGATSPSPLSTGLIMDAARGVGSAAKEFWQGLSGQTMPKTTESNRAAGEAGARYLSSRIAAKYAADEMASDVLETGVDEVKFGAALTEDNLRSVKANFEKQAGDLKTEASKTINPVVKAVLDEQSAKAAGKAANVRTIVGSKNSPFKTEADFQAYLKQPDVVEAINRHKAHWNDTIEPMFKQAMDIDPSETLPGRGAQTEARINLYVPPEDVPARDFVSFGPNLTATFKRKSPFGRQARGTAETYGLNYRDIVNNTFARQLEIANKNEFDKALVRAGDAEIGPPGEKPTLKGEATQAFPLVRRTIVIVKGEPVTIAQNQNIYVRKSLANEYGIASNAYRVLSKDIVPKVTEGLNRLALAGLTDASVHVSNLATILFTRPASGNLAADALLSSLGRADIPVTITRAIQNGIKADKNQLADLARIGALREEHPGAGPMNRLLSWTDRAVRVTLDNTYQELASKGLVENSETARREFVNQAGQYNKRAQDALTKELKESGVSPFLTAGKAFTTLGMRNVAMSPGVKATSAANAFKLRADIAAKWVGSASLIMALNYYLTGKVGGRPGTPLGNIDTGKNDANGHPQSIRALDLMGFGRGLRVTGIKGAADAMRKGLTPSDALNSSVRDVANTYLGMVSGPVVRTASVALSGSGPAIGVPRVSEVAPPGGSQVAENIKAAAANANPTLAGLMEGHIPGQPWNRIDSYNWDKVLEKQMPRGAPQATQRAEMIEHYPEIVRKAQASEFINDVIRRARAMPLPERRAYLADSINRLQDEGEKTKARREFIHRRVYQD
jgi:hypothetical protein